MGVVAVPVAVPVAAATAVVTVAMMAAPEAGAERVQIRYIQPATKKPKEHEAYDAECT